MSRPQTNRASTRIVIADDHLVVRAGLRAVLRHQRDMTVVGEASTADELVRVAREVQPDVAVVDLLMPGDTLQAINELTSSSEGLSVVIFTAFDQAADAALCFQAGASGYVTKMAPEEELLGAIRRVRAGGYHVDPSLGPALLERILERGSIEEAATPLSVREAEVLQLTALGYSNRQMAERLRVSVKSIETYRRRIGSKLGLKSRVEVTRYVMGSGIFERKAKGPGRG